MGAQLQTVSTDFVRLQMERDLTLMHRIIKKREVIKTGALVGRADDITSRAIKDVAVVKYNFEKKKAFSF